MYTIEEIIHLTGLPGKKASEICSLLCSEGYLIYDSDREKYRLTDQKNLLDHIERVKDQLNDEHTLGQICSKIDDIITLGRPLALSEMSRERTIHDIGIPGLNIIFSGLEKEDKQPSEGINVKETPGLPRGHCLLVKGAPGTGKTTMGMQIVIHLVKYRTLFLTFEEDIDQLAADLVPYCMKDDPDKYDNVAVGWRKSDLKKVARSLKRILTPTAWDNVDLVLQEMCSILDRELPQLVVIDSISRFRDIGGEAKSRQVLRRLIRTLKSRGITSIFLGEDRGETNAFEEYEADGIIRLAWVGDQLSLKVTKLRGIRSYKGPHSAALLTVDDLKEKDEHRLIAGNYPAGQPQKFCFQAGFNVFPDIVVYKDFPYSKKKEETKRKGNGDDTTPPTDQDVESPDEPIDSGTEGLNKLLPLKKGKGGFKKGEMVILIGSAGSGKTLLALNFMLAGYKKYNQTGDEKKKIGVWINLEGELGTLEFAIHGFEGPIENSLKDMIKSAKRPDDAKRSEHGPYFKFLSFPPINLDLNKILYILAALHEKCTIDRIVIDSITELERAKSGAQPEVKVFLAGLIQFLRDRGITAMFICRSDTFFRSIDKIEEQILSLVDLIISIRNFDMRNQIHKGVYIQKARGRAHNSKILRMTIDSRKGIDIEDSGWDVEHLLAGDTSNIQPPRVFFKLFYENPAEEDINDEIIRDFDETRYPGDEPIFREVKKSSIHTEFWSFRGQYSAGHANTRVLSIADHVISAFRDNKRLTELENYVKGELIKNIETDPYLLRLFDPEEKNSEKHIIDAIPSYRDFGVMVYKKFRRLKRKKGSLTDEGRKHVSTYLAHLNFFSTIPQKMYKEYDNDIDWLGTENDCGKYLGYIWENLINWIKNTNNAIKEARIEKIRAFAFPPLDNKSEFIAFFMELLWSYGGDIYDIEIYTGYKIENYRLKSKEIIKRRIIYDLKECGDRMIVREPEKKNPKETYNEEFTKFKSDLTKKGADTYKIFKERFERYNIAQGRVDFDKLMKWTVKKLVPKNKKGKNILPEIVLNWNSYPFKKTIDLILDLIYKAGVINPIHGDYRGEAVLSRCWYSHLCDKKKAAEEKDPSPSEPELLPNSERKLLPLPLAKVGIEETGGYYYRSVSCNTYWCLVMLKDALSPEIGGNFIESLVAPEYYKKRLKSKAGMPSVNWELGKQEFIDIAPEAYALMNRVTDNGIIHEELNKKLSNSKKEDINKILGDNDNAFVRYNLLKKIDKGGHLQNFEKKKVSEINKRMFYPKYRQSRIGFYHIEQALHYQIRQILKLETEKGKPQDLNGAREIIKEHINELYEDGPIGQEKGWEDTLEKIINEFRLHVILELLVSFYLEDEEEIK